MQDEWAESDRSKRKPGVGKASAGKEINFMPAADPKAPKRQPVNRPQPQAPSMPANRFMAPAASAVKGELGERFR